MDKDIEIIYECIFEKAYKHRISLESTISKVDEPKIAIGFMMELALNHSAYEIDKEGLPRMIAEYIGETKSHEYMVECHREFVKAMKIKNDWEIAQSALLEKILHLLIFEANEEFDKLLSSCDQNRIIRLKDQLLEAEAYEYIAAIDKYIK